MTQAPDPRYAPDDRTRDVPPVEPVDIPPVAPVHVEHTEQVVRGDSGVEHSERVVRDSTGVEHRETFSRDAEAERAARLSRISRIVSVIIALIEIIIGLRVLLKLVGANANNDFASFIYNLAAVFLAPFFGITGSPAAGGVVLEIPSLIGMVVYALIGWVIVSLIWPLFDRPTTSTTSSYHRTRD